MADEQNNFAGEGNNGEAPVAADVAEYMAASQATPTAGTETQSSPADDGSQTIAQGDQAAQDGQVPTQLSDEDKQKLEQEVETALADERTPKWFKHAVENVYKPKLAEFDERFKSFEPLQTYGEVPQIIERLEMLNGLGTLRTNPQSGMPERTTEPFVQKLHETEPEVAYQLIDDLCKLPSPYTQGFTVLQELFARVGIDPARLGDVQKFAANGYQLTQGNYPPPDPVDLEEIPQALRATYSQMSPEDRDALMLMPELTRNQALENAKFRSEEEGRRASWQQQEQQRAAQEKQQQEIAFRQQLDTKSYENFSKAADAVFTSFVGSLAQQAGLSKMDSLMIANTVLNSFEDTLAGKQSLEALKAEGIDVDPTIAPTIKALEEAAGHIAFYELRQDEANKNRAVAKLLELQERLTAKGNKLVASVLQKRKAGTQAFAAAANGQSQIAPGATNPAQLNGHPSPIGASSPSNFDFSEEAYERLLAEGGGYRRS